jgi:hypothetical protein
MIGRYARYGHAFRFQIGDTPKADVSPKLAFQQLGQRHSRLPARVSCDNNTLCRRVRHLVIQSTDSLVLMHRHQFARFKAREMA